ncbi:MAG: hypothetical protein ACRECW_04675 [Phyllobacterium sp.]
MGILNFRMMFYNMEQLFLPDAALWDLFQRVAQQAGRALKTDDTGGIDAV